jgi:hypothetical protein
MEMARLAILSRVAEVEVALVFIQKFWRKYKTHCLLQSLMERSRASVKLQAKFRSVRRRSTLLKGSADKQRVLTNIHESMQRRSKQEHAAIMVQKWFRGNNDRQYFALRYVVLTRNALTIQKAWRIYWVHCHIDTW